MSQLLDNVVGELTKLPGVGRRTALRLALHILRWDIEEADQFAGSIYQFRRDAKRCARCNNLSDNELCDVCCDPQRDHSTVCVVENVADLLTIEGTGNYGGMYHVLGGVISPLSGVTPSDLGIDKLLKVIEQDSVKEVILALPSTIEAETTQFYITRRLSGVALKVSVISRGIALGDEIEYADALSISHALLNRKVLE
ncbi:MAG: recombination mediator RecR [Rikenellaceae bacterium]